VTLTAALAALPPAGTPGGEAARAAIVGGLFLLVFVAAEAWRAVARPPVEWTRKTVHAGGGIIATAFPWIFSSHWTVLGLGAVFAAILWGTRRLGLLQSVHGVERRSEGGLFYPLAVYLLFVVAGGTPVFYLVAILALVVSDTVAAVVGTEYGRITFSVEAGDRRSLEGSTVFFLATFLGAHLPLLLLTDGERAATVLVALQIALIVTFFEAVCLHGSDNLVVPLVTYFLLVKLTPRPAEFIAAQLMAQLLVVGTVSWVALRTHILTASGAIAATLFLYGAFALGGPEWLVAPGLALTGLLTVYLRSARLTSQPRGEYQVAAVFYSTILPAALLVGNNALETLLPVGPELARTDPLYAPYVGVLAGHLGMLALTWRSVSGAVERVRVARAAATALLWVVPAGLLVAADPVAPGEIVAAVAIPLLALGLYAAARAAGRAPEGGAPELRLQALCSLTALAVVLPPYFILSVR